MSLPTIPPDRPSSSAGGVALPSSYGGRLASGDSAPADRPNGGGLAASAAQTLDGLASQHDLLPTKLLRPSCTIPAETLLRQIGHLCTTREPWLPLATLGPLLIMGHHAPGSDDYWGLPEFLVIRVLISREDYLDVARDLHGRLQLQPIAATNPNVGVIPPPPADLTGVFRWFCESYPFSSAEEREKMVRLQAENAEKTFQRLEDLSFLPRHYGVALWHLATGAPVFNPEQAPAQGLFPAELLEKHTVYPLFIGDSTVWLLAASPSVYAFEDEWLSSGHASTDFRVVLADSAAIRATIARDRARSARDVKGGSLVGELYHSDQIENLVEIDPVDIARVNPANPNNTPEQTVQWILWRAIAMRASDLHVEKFYNTARFRARVDGELVTLHSCSEEFLQRYVAMFKNYCGMGQQRQDTQDARFSMRLGQKRIDVRVAAIPCRREQQKLVMRFLDKQDGIKKLSELNLSPRQMSIVREVSHRDQGLVLVTGPTGSGKTTTLYAFINAINTDNINIQTIEDPIEYEIEGINQTQTDPFHGITFAAGLRSLLRCDPDVILVGESRDAETAQASVNAALTGHLVFTTLHANDSLRAISRLLSMGVEPYLLADSLALSQAQRLVRRLCSFCKTATPVTDEIADFLNLNGVLPNGKKPDTPVYNKGGCAECNGTGYSGRVALMEMCPATAELQALIAENAPMTELRKVAMKDGFMSLYQEGLMHVLAGNTTFEEIACLSYTAPVMLNR